MKERPIIFSGEMVRAILSGQKTQTRRVCKPANDNNLSFIVAGDKGGHVPETPADVVTFGDEDSHVEFRCPYGLPGDRLWVREAWRFNGKYHEYRADYPTFSGDVKWKPSIYMPRNASRILLEVESVRVERLCAISDTDCKAEGCPGGHGSIPDYGYSALPQEHYFWLWDKINGKDASTANPWVWVIQFCRVQP